MDRKAALGFALLLLGGIVAPYFIYPVYVMHALCFALFAAAYNLLLGFGGLLSFGHAAYFGSASYVTAYMLKAWGASPELGILGGVAVAALLGGLFGWVAIKRTGIYFAMITLALAQLVYFIAVQAKFTNGDDGLRDVPRGRLLGFLDLNDPIVIYSFVLIVFLLAMLFIYRAIHSPFGHVLKAIRENESRAISLGYRTERYKLLAFVLSAGLSGLAGSVKVLVFQIASLVDIGSQISGEVVLMTLIGGIGTVFGPVIGAFAVISLENVLAQYGYWVRIVQGLAFILCVLVFRRGIAGEFNRQMQSMRLRSFVDRLRR